MTSSLAYHAASIILISLFALIGAFSDPIGVVAVLLMLAVGAMAFARRKRVPLVLAVIGAGLLGYALFGRGFAYVGVRPFFIGEALLATALVTAMLDRGSMSLFRQPLARLIALFMLVGIASAAPYLGAYGLDVLRDSVVWAYALFALTIARFFEHSQLPQRAVALFRHVALWFPIAMISLSLARALSPLGSLVLPGTGVPLLGFKAGDVAVHLSAVAAFALLSLNNRSDVGRASWRSWGIGWWLGWLVALLLTANRAGLLAATLSLVLVATMRPTAMWLRVIAVALALLLIPAALDVELQIGDGRPIATEELFERFTSIFVPVEDSRLNNTRQWRLDWWSDIISYTFGGPYFWTGKGYGINLATADGYQVLADDSLRSPHNGHMTILARSGVPGLMVWLILQTTFAVGMLRTFAWYQRNGRDWWARVTLWLLAYWLAWIVHMSFDVVIEGPQGGIWFWSVFGAGMAVMSLRHKAKYLAAERE